MSLATALVQSKLDYSNSVVCSTSTSNLHKLQMVQNGLARTITRSSRSVPTSQPLSNLHWLSIHKRINFTVAILTYKVFSTQQPAYIYNLIPYHQPRRSLRSCSHSLLYVPRVKTDFGRRAFSFAAPQIWTHIPTAIKVSPSLDSFKRHLKTHFYLSIILSPPIATAPHLWFNFYARQHICYSPYMPRQFRPSVRLSHACIASYGWTYHRSSFTIW